MRTMFHIIIGISLILNTINVDANSLMLRLRRKAPTIDSSLEKPVLNPLTERTAVDSSWEQSMIISPMTIQLLGQLLLVSSTKDVSLRAFSPDRRFDYIKNPNSFRATLLQVSQEGYKAFLSGHSTMHIIQLRMIQIPKHIKTALKLLAGNFPQRVLGRLLPQVLKNIDDTGNECVTETNKTRNEFERVMDLLGEVLQTTVTLESEHVQNVEQNERQLEILREQKAGLEKQEKIRAQHYQEAKDGANKAEETYYKALKDIPTGFKAILRDFARGMLKIANTVAEAAATAIVSYKTRGISMGNGVGGSQGYGSGGFINTVGNQQPLPFGLSETINMADKFTSTLQKFQNTILDPKAKVKQIEGYIIAFRAFREFIESLPANSAKGQVIELIQRAEDLAHRATANAKQVTSTNETDTTLADEVNDILQQLVTFQSANQLSDPRTASNVISNVGRSGGHSSGDSSQNEVLKAQIAQTHLTEMRRRQDEQAAEYLKLLDTMHKTNAKMKEIDLTTIDYKAIIAMLRDALSLLTQIDEQWKKFVLFFTKMSIYISDMIKGPLKRFLQLAGEGHELDRALRLDLIDTLKEDTFGIHREAYILYVMSRTYYEVSSKYLMGRLGSLSSMLNSRTTDERKELAETLQRQTNQTLDEIKELILERKNTFDTELNNRNTELTTLIDQLGGPKINDRHTIEEARRITGEQNDSGNTVKPVTTTDPIINDDDEAWGDN